MFFNHGVAIARYAPPPRFWFRHRQRAVQRPAARAKGTTELALPRRRSGPSLNPDRRAWKEPASLSSP